MIDTDVLEHRRLAQLALTAPGDPLAGHKAVNKRARRKYKRNYKGTRKGNYKGNILEYKGNYKW